MQDNYILRTTITCTVKIEILETKIGLTDG